MDFRRGYTPETRLGAVWLILMLCDGLGEALLDGATVLSQSGRCSNQAGFRDSADCFPRPARLLDRRVRPCRWFLRPAHLLRKPPHLLVFSPAVFGGFIL